MKSQYDGHQDPKCNHDIMHQAVQFNAEVILEQAQGKLSQVAASPHHTSPDQPVNTWLFASPDEHVVRVASCGG